MKTKDLIGNVVAVSFVSLLFIFALTWIIFDFNGSSSSLKDTWSIVGSVFWWYYYLSSGLHRILFV